MRKFHLAKDIKDISDAVFTSMSLPLVFEPILKKDEDGKDQYYEDGGVIDNLPAWFGTELEQCDLLFVLTLNANFEKQVERGMLLKRLLRALDVRQGVLERKSLQLISQYNKITRLQNEANDYRRLLEELSAKLVHSDAQSTFKITSLLEKHPDEGAPDRREVDIFAICPGRGVPEQDKPAPKPLIGTIEFWKNKEAAKAFCRMEDATKCELEQFFQTKKQHGQLIVVEDNGVSYVPFFDP